jgi:hypothetical protein
VLPRQLWAGLAGEKELGIPLDDEDLPPQTIMARLLRDLEW